LLGLSSALASEETRVVSGSQGKGDFPDVDLYVTWLRLHRTAAVGRELGDPSTTGRTTVVKDLFYKETRNVLRLRADIGLFRDLSLFVIAPLVLSDDRSLDFDRRGNSCAGVPPTGMGPAPEPGPSASCVDEGNSTLLRDGILPGAGMASYGLDAPHERPFARPSQTVFRGPTRKGFEYVAVGLSWALMNQKRDPTKPTWILRFEPRLQVGETMSFDPVKPLDNKAVGLGYHQFVFSTVFSRKFVHFEPYMAAWYMLPKETGSSPFGKYPLGTEGFGGPQHRAGAQMGVELVAYDDVRARTRVTVEVRGEMELRFFGLARSELWEPLSGRSSCPADPTSCRREIDVDLDSDGKVDPFPGITRSPSYGVFVGSAGLNIEAGRYVRLRALAGLSREQDRFISDGRSGIESIDQPGRRFRVEEAGGWHLLVEGGLLF
jgi:hypothetical protein